MKIVADHGWPIASDGSDGRGPEAFQNERDYIAQSGRHKTTVAAMDWAWREIERLQTANRQSMEMADARSIENVGLTAEITRLRTALGNIVRTEVLMTADQIKAYAKTTLGVHEQSSPKEE